MHLELHHPGFTHPIYFTPVYAKSTRPKRRQLWTDLSFLQQMVADKPLAISGDFNAIASLNESVGTVLLDASSMEDFVAFLVK